MIDGWSAGLSSGVTVMLTWPDAATDAEWRQLDDHQSTSRGKPHQASVRVAQPVYFTVNNACGSNLLLRRTSDAHKLQAASHTSTQCYSSLLFNTALQPL